jgi:trk system potassium uptake protein TrkA
VILSVIEQEIPAEHLVPLLRLRYADVEVVEAVLDHRSRVIGKPLRELALPPESTIAVVIRQGQPIFPTGQTVLQAGDEILAFTRSKHEAELSRLLWGK